MPRSSVAARLESLGYELLVWEEPGTEPERTGRSFADVVPRLRGSRVAGWRLYRHQLESIEALGKGYNVVLTARTGSGKTEAWALAALRHGWRVLAVYPTLALAADQIRRLEEYYEAAGYGRSAVVRVDRPSIGRRRGESLLAAIASARVVVTNPAFLLADMKRMAVSPGRSFLEDFLSGVDLVVFDELDFYGPRGAHLLLSMVELVSRHLASTPPRVVVLSATIGNPGELARYLEEVTGRASRVIEGKPFKAPNRVIVVLGKGLGALRRYVEAYAPVIASRARWILDTVRDPEELREHFYEVYEALEAIGLRPPRPGLDPVEILQAVVESSEPGSVTLVFTRSIRMAEKLYRMLQDRLPEALRGLVAVHHHLVPKDRRERIEEAARRGEIRMIITVRTLAQGIDIGTVNRVVHVGLPVDLREYMQREGRKGRRKEAGTTETIVVPSGLWDRKLLEQGSSAFKQWLSLSLEKLYINPSNAYAAIFRGMWRILRGLPPSREEEKLLRSMGLVEEVETLGGARLALSRRGKSFWNDIGFYEHGPPYGYRKVIVRSGRETLLRSEEVSSRDAVEKYQPGAYDPMTEYVVVRVEPREYRIYEQPLDEAVAEHAWLARAVARYEDVKRAWGERPSLDQDLRYGRLYTLVLLNVSAPTRGFGELLEEPVDVKWLVESRRPRLGGASGGAPRVYHEMAGIELNAPVAGRYRDYTYGYVFEAPAGLGAEDLRLGLAFLMVALRVMEKHSIPLGLIEYRVVSAGGVRLIHMWEREAAGLLDVLDWAGLAEEVEAASLPGVAVALAAAVDPEAALRVLRGEVTLDAAKRLAAAAARVIAGTQRVKAGGVLIEHPRPGPQHGLAGLGVAYEHVEDQEGRQVAVAAVAAYDGERVEVDSLAAPLGLSQAGEMAQLALRRLDQLLSRDLRVAVYGEDQRKLLTRMLAGSYMGLAVLRAAEEEGRVVDAARLAAERVGDATPVLLALEPRLRDYLEWAARAKARRDPEELENALRSLARALAQAAYRAALAALKGRLELLEGEGAGPRVEEPRRRRHG